MDQLQRKPSLKLAFIRSTVLTAAVFTVIWLIYAVTGSSGYTPPIRFVNLIGIPSLPRCLDILFGAPMGGFIGLLMATWKSLPENSLRSPSQESTASRIQTTMWVSAMSGALIIPMHYFGTKESPQVMGPAVALMLLIISLIATIPKINENIVLGSSGVLGISFGLYYGMFPGLMLFAMMILVFVASVSVGWLVIRTVRAMRTVLTWSCGL